MRTISTGLSIVFVFLFGQLTFSQESGPKVLVLSPNQHTFKSSMEKELIKKVADYKAGLDLDAAEEFFKSTEFKKRPENVQLISRSEVDYLKTLDHVKLTSYLAEQHLSYPLIGKFKKAVITLKDEKSTGEISDLNRIATAENVNFILHFNNIELYQESKQSFAKITVQLFDRATGTLLLDSSFIGGWDNPGFEYTCEDKSTDCCINNALEPALYRVYELIVANDPSAKKERELKLARTKVLSEYLQKPFDKQVLKAIIPTTDTTILIENAYQILFSVDRTKFVAFFTESVPETDGKAFQKRKNDLNANIVSDDQMGFFGGKLPNTYAHIVKGILYNGKWYYEKAEVTYFDAESSANGQEVFFNYVHKWRFFNEQEATVNPGFWEATGKSGRTLATTSLFEKVPDLKKDPNWEKYKEMWESEEQKNRPYVGLYQIVADQLQEQEEKKN